MGSGVMIYKPSFIQFGSDIQRLMGGRGSQTHRHIDSREIA
jgi:hypothetical protein